MKLEKAVLVCGLLGLVFAGYLSGVKLFTETCAFNESCPYFLGLPACYFGFVMYLIITISAALRVFGRMQSESANQVVLITSGLGIVFAGYFTIGELPLLVHDGFRAYVFGLPTCALGLIFYVAIFVMSLKIRSHAMVQSAS